MSGAGAHIIATQSIRVAFHVDQYLTRGRETIASIRMLYIPELIATQTRRSRALSAADQTPTSAQHTTLFPAHWCAAVLRADKLVDDCTGK